MEDRLKEEGGELTSSTYGGKSRKYLEDETTAGADPNSLRAIFCTDR